MYSLSLLVFDVSDSNEGVHQVLSTAHIALLEAIPRIGMAKFIENMIYLESNSVIFDLEYPEANDATPLPEGLFVLSRDVAAPSWVCCQKRKLDG